MYQESQVVTRMNATIHNLSKERLLEIIARGHQMATCRLSEFRSAIAVACGAPQSDACAGAVERGAVVFGAKCLAEPLFDGAPPLSLYVCPGATSPLLRAQCGIESGSGAETGGGAETGAEAGGGAERRTETGGETGGGAESMSMAMAARVGTGGTMLTLLAGRYGLIPGRPGLALTGKIGTHSANVAVVTPYVSRAIRDLDDGAAYRSNPVISKIQYDRIQAVYPSTNRFDRIAGAIDTLQQQNATARTVGLLEKTRLDSTIRQKRLQSRVMHLALNRVAPQLL